MIGSLGNPYRRVAVVCGWALLSAGVASSSSLAVAAEFGVWRSAQTAQVGPPVKLAPIAPTPTQRPTPDPAPASKSIPDIRDRSGNAARVEVDSLSAVDSDWVFWL
jgi:hypothetical protein